jgi:AraC-like DNA-binding protein
MTEIISIEYDHLNYEKFIYDQAGKLGTSAPNGNLSIPADIADGKMQALIYPNGLQALKIDVEVKKDIRMQRSANTENYYLLWFYDARPRENMVIQFQHELLYREENLHQGTLLSTTAKPLYINVKAGIHVRGLFLMFSENWLKQYTGLEADSTLIREYFSLQHANAGLEPWDGEYRRLVEEVLQDSDHPFRPVMEQNRMMLLIERFFTRLHEKLVDKRYTNDLSVQDTSRLIEVEHVLLNDFSSPPPVIDSLAKLAGMSSSKLKNCFKNYYGTSIYQYYLRHKMQKAKELLLTSGLPVKQVGLQLGYSNLSHFARAFKKEVGMLPSELMN